MLNINFKSVNFNGLKNVNSVEAKRKYSNLAPLRCDTVSFGTLKKTQFSGIDLLIVNKYKAPIEKFNTNDDFQKWCGQ